MSIHKNFLILSNKLNRFNYQQISSISNNSFNSSVDQNESNQQFNCANSLSDRSNDEYYQFNEQLIKRIKKNQLFNVDYFKKNVNNVPKINLTADIQKYLPSVSKIINETMTEDKIRILELWKAKMIKKLGIVEFQKYQNDLFSKGILKNLI